MNTKRKILASVLLLSSAVSMSAVNIQASDKGVREAIHTTEASVERALVRNEISVTKITNKNPSAYTKTTLTYNGKKTNVDARVIADTVFVAVEDFVKELTGFSATYDNTGKILKIRGTGFDIEVIDGGNVIYANGRTFFAMTPSTRMNNGKTYASLDLLTKIFGFKSSGVTALSGSIKPLQHGSTYYREDAVYWLSRIISAESRGESLIGQLAVGTVVLNRVASPLYPNTIWGVIFDKKYGVQFSPVLDGSIYATPNAVSVTAAKICLEGYNVNDSALFFLYPKNSTSSWIPNNREYLFTIGKHDFYA